jgi:hypothetical protein
MSKNHVVITGTGRCGTTFLVELLTQLGLETGFKPDELERKKNKIANAGLEYDFYKHANLPYIAKSPWFCDHVKEVVDQDDLEIDHVFVPIRNIFEAAESRRQVYRKNLRKESLYERLSREIKCLTQPWRKAESLFYGGLVHTRSLKKGAQEAILLKQFHTLMLHVSEAGIPVTIMQYPRITKDPRYLFERLQQILKGIDYDTFEVVFRKTSRQDLVHSYQTH